MKTPWIAVDEKFPPDSETVDVWFDVYASPLSFGMADSWCENGKWFHFFKGEKAELNSRYITHWKPLGSTAIDGPDSIIWKAGALAR